MATTTLTNNLKLRISSDLTADSKYNLQRLDSLGSIYQVDTNQTAKVRSQTNIIVQPNDPDIGGGGSGGTVQIGTTDQPISTFQVFADSVSLSASLSLTDQATGGSKNLNIGYKSDISGAVDTTANRSLLFDVEGADRNVVFGGNFNINNDLTFTLSGATTLTLPTSGTVVTNDNTVTLTNKTINASNNTLSNIANVHVAAAAAIAGSKIDPDFGAQEVQSTSGFSSTASVAFKMPNADGTSGQAVTTNGSGQLQFASVATTNLAENNVIIGNSSNVQADVDTTVVGDIQADATNGLTIKAGAIVNADVNASAAIAISKLGTTTASRALETNGSGAITASTVTSTELGYLSGVTSAIQTQLDAKQALDSDLTALAGLSTTGLITRTGAGSAVTRTIVAGSSKISITNGNGFVGNPSIDLGTVDTDDITEGATNLFFTNERAQDAVGTILTDTASVDFTYNDAGGTISAVVLPAGVDHDSLNNFVANEHVDHSGVSVVAGGDDGLTATNNSLTTNIGLAVDINGTTAETSIQGADSILIYDSTAAALRKATLTNVFAGVALQTHKANWTQTDGSSVIITHNLGTLDVRVELYDTADGATVIPDTVTRNSTNQVTLTGANLPGTFDFRVLISAV